MTTLTPLPAGLLTVEHRPGIAYSGAMRRYEPIQSLPDGEHKLYTQATLQREQDEVLRLEGEVARLRGALADIGASADMTLEIARSKAMRVYHETADAAMKETP